VSVERVSILELVAPDLMKTIVYLCYGHGQHVFETTFSILSAFRFGPLEHSGHQYVIYTDDPGSFVGLGVKLVKLDAATLGAWMGKDGYVHRRKIMTMIDALSRFPGSVVFVDSDTYFLKPPGKLFDQVAPGRSRLHILEARLLESGTRINRAISVVVGRNSFQDLSGRPFKISRDAYMWNDGVLGLHSSDAYLMEEALNLGDQMWPKLQDAPLPVHNVNQFVSGYFLERTLISESHNIVYHYWPANLRVPFRQRLPELLAAGMGSPFEERARKAFAERPRANTLWKIRMGVRTGLRRLGVRVPGVRTNDGVRPPRRRGG
jgi:hypothetical protein